MLKVDKIYNIDKVYDSYQGRVTLDRHTAQLRISELRLEDSGKYECEIRSQDTWFYESFDLQVLGKTGFVTIWM